MHLLQLALGLLDLHVVGSLLLEPAAGPVPRRLPQSLEFLLALLIALLESLAGGLGLGLY